MMGMVILIGIGIAVFYLLLWPKNTAQVDRAPQHNQPRLPQEAVATTLSEESRARLDALEHQIEALTQPGLRGRMTEGETGPEDSRIGGPLAWPVGEAPPVDDRGKRLTFLAQVNLADLPTHLDLPTEGLLQVLVGSDDLFGCAFPSKNGQNMCVVLHPAGAPLAMHPAPPIGVDGSPLARNELAEIGRGVVWDLMDCPPPTADHRLNEHLPYHDGIPKAEMDARHTLLDSMAEKRGRYDIMLRGNPDFTQDDARHDESMKAMENLIAFSSIGTAFMWGDVGEATILVDPACIPKMDLSGVLYTWDCC